MSAPTHKPLTQTVSPLAGGAFQRKMLSMPLVPRTFWVDIELDTLSTYLEHMSSYVDAQVVQLHRTVQGLTKDLDPDD